jgi:cytochrome P450
LAGTAVPEKHALSWFELTAAASAFLPHPLLALACDSNLEIGTVLRTEAAYFPWVSLAIAMLDSYVDQAEDRREANHSYIAYYGSEATAIDRVCEIVRRSINEVRSLPGGPRHAVLVAAMVAMYLSKPDAGTAQMSASARQLLEAGGSVSRVLVPQLRVWRLLHDGPRAIGKTHPRRLPPGLPLPAPLQTLLFWKSPLTYLESCQRRYGTRFTLRATSHPPLVFLSDPADIRAVFAARAEVLHPGQGAETIRPLVGVSSFMVCEEEEHLATRRVVLPAFHAKIVQEHADTVATIVAKEIAAWPRDVCFALHPRLRALTLQLILHTVFGVSATSDPMRTFTLRNRLLAMFDVTATPILAEPLLRRGPGRPAWQRFLRERAAVDELICDLIDERRDVAAGASDVLARLLAVRTAAGAAMSSQWVRDNLISIILAGHETTAAELAWAFQLLAHHPQRLERLVNEIDHGDSDAYLAATVQEVLRHRPVFLFAIPRRVAQPIEIGGWSYPLDTQLLGCIYLAQHDPMVYSQPYEFQPERFLAGPPASNHWLPWGGGRKRCPGLHLATLEMKTVLRTVLANRTVCAAARQLERPRWRSVIVTPGRGGRVVLSRRKRAYGSKGLASAGDPGVLRRFSE